MAEELRIEDIDDSKVRPHLFQECNALDASCFCGDALWEEVNRQYLTAMIGRWTRSIAEHEKMAKEVEEETDTASDLDEGYSELHDN